MRFDNMEANPIAAIHVRSTQVIGPPKLDGALEDLAETHRARNGKSEFKSKQWLRVVASFGESFEKEHVVRLHRIHDGIEPTAWVHIRAAIVTE